MNYAATAANAAKLLAKFGQVVTLRVTTPGTYNPATGTETGASVTDHVAVAVITSISTRLVDGTRVRLGDKMAIIAPNIGTGPRPGDVLLVGGVAYSVVSVETVSPGGVVLAYRAQVRRS